MAFFQTRSKTIYYELEGEGEVVVLLNGILMNTRSWSYQREALRGYRVLLHDFSGQGQSSKPKEGYSLENHGEDLLLLLDSCGIERAHLIGISYGGEVALQFVLDYPERVSSLLLAAVVSEIKPLLFSMVRVWELGALLEDGGMFYDLLVPFIYSNGFIENNRRWLQRQREMFISMVDPQFLGAFRGLLKSFLNLHLTPHLHRIEAKTLLLAGEEDILKPPLYSHILAEEIKGSRLEVLPHTGHAISLEVPEIFNQRMLSFLEDSKDT